MKTLTKDGIRRSDREPAERTDSDGRIVVDAITSGLKRGFLKGMSAQAHIIMPPVSVPAYKGRGLAGDWAKVGGDLWSAVKDHSSKK